MRNPLSAPKQPLRRVHMFSVRLTSTERDAIKQLAREMNVSPSHMVRHFLMQAVDYYQQEHDG